MSLDLESVSLREKISVAASNKDRLRIIYAELMNDDSTSESLADELACLHNESIIDVIAVFRTLNRRPEDKVLFFPARNLFEMVLPKINSEMAQVIDCIHHLITEAGQDMSALEIIKPFTQYCALSLSRSKEGLDLIIGLDPKYMVFLPPILAAGSRIDINWAFQETKNLINSENIEFRRRAVFSLGRLSYPASSPLIKDALVTLETLVDRETDDILLAHAMDSICSLYDCANILESRICQLVDTVLLKGNDFSLHQASQLFWIKAKELPNSLIEIFLNHLRNVKITNRGTLDNIDYGLTHLFSKGEYDKVLSFLEYLLVENQDNLQLDIFDSFSNELLQNKDDILSRVVTRWFLRGDRALCNGVANILRHDRKILLSVEPSELYTSQPDQFLFLARKTIGYLFMNPISATSMLVTLLKVAADAETRQHLSDLLYDPLLMNYSEEVFTFLKQQMETISEQSVRDSIENAILAFEHYLADLKSVDDISELHPTQENREIFSRRFSRQVSEAMKNAEKESVLLSIMPKSVLLYGRKSIDYVYASDGEARRMEVPLKSFGTEFNLPRLENLDPFGLDYMLRIFKAEQLVINETDH
jgi:hypothetical protein